MKLTKTVVETFLNLKMTVFSVVISILYIYIYIYMYIYIFFLYCNYSISIYFFTLFACNSPLWKNKNKNKKNKREKKKKEKKEKKEKENKKLLKIRKIRIITDFIKVSPWFININLTFVQKALKVSIYIVCIYMYV